ncbi:MarR family winged helix-turn-helix transcriptional regulator [Paenibacillus chitinolyticus]|uniref:MarR family winged helix-turn-helix transcriptional regulator n=1 Tax=Paenibacillus chitinolyticus TaxID=79263 RepID=UPI002DB87760|nr:MarR family transcriptional regulator [Paenibacillus chitinolyticus]MEC0248098.1 MarR family transcriptional regulator [Paenibacillus chitinolyticus]
MEEQDRIHRIFQSYREVNQAFFQVLMKAAQLYGLTPVQLLTLKNLKEHPNIGLGELSEYILLGTSTTSGIVDRLVKAGLVSRERSETDRRSVTLKLTEKGLEQWNLVEREHMDRLYILASVSEEDQRQLERINTQILEILQKVRDEETHEYRSTQI